MAQIRPRNAGLRAPTSVPMSANSDGAMSASSSTANMTGSKMKTKEPAYQCGLKGKNGRTP